MIDSSGEVDGQDINGDLANRRLAGQDWSLPFKVCFPIILTRMKQRNQCAREFVPANQIWAFPTIACEAGDAKIVGRRFTVVLCRDDVVHFEGKWIKSLWHPTVFTATVGAIPNLFAEFAIHDAELFPSCRSVNRAFDCSSPTDCRPVHSCRLRPLLRG